MGRHFHCTDEIVVVSKGKGDIGKVPALGNDGKLDPSVIPGIQKPAGKFHMKQAVSLPSGVPNYIDMPEIEYDTGNFHTSDPSRFQINETGIYLLEYQMYLTEYQENTTMSICKGNGETIVASNPFAFGNIIALARLQKGEYVRPVVQHITNKTLQVRLENNLVPHFSIIKLSD